MWREGNQLWMAKKEAKLAPADKPVLALDYSAWIKPPAALELSNGWRLESRTLPATQGLFDSIRLNLDKWQVWLDLIGSNCRCWCGGAGAVTASVLLGWADIHRSCPIS